MTKAAKASSSAKTEATAADALEAEIRLAQEKLAALQVQKVDKIKEQLSEAKDRVAKLEEELAAITGDSGKTKTKSTKRKRLSSSDIYQRITEGLRKSGAAGLSQIAIHKETGINYGTVGHFLKTHADIITDNGKSLKEKRYTLKG
ncbi:hypothetical protein DB346_02670 [Verrucomicrobia bacterium LW23]|nr:hypothetical protein DB346_03985 [Verrucomicrobia bacterium LW23]PTY04352.1 hypothetical protein DB346_02670 [Verrucomicrobia bacterium LW23]